MMYGSDATFKCDEPKVENIAIVDERIYVI